MAVVVPQLYHQGKLTAKRALIYRDADGIFDRVVHADGRFVGFEPLRAKTRAEAVKALSRADRSKSGDVS